MNIYVDVNVAADGIGTSEAPYRTINEAVKAAMPGDCILVMPGVYHEDISPIRSGEEGNPIVFKSVEPLQAVITGAEVIKTWVRYRDDVWCVRIPNSFFGDYNPYTTYVWGDWLDQQIPCHTGEVYLNDKSLYEVPTLEEVISPSVNDASWDIDFTTYTWYTCQDEDSDETVIYANFHGADPNAECVEINVRPHCFYALNEHTDYITLSGFTVTKAATQWAPPTALQDGMIGPHWSKGWVIEDCEISHSKCSGISLGKYYQEGNDNKWSHYKLKDGAQTQRACSLIAWSDGWSKDTVGSHTVRRCNIHDCGQTGIVGNLGCVFSLIENNHIHHINNKRNLAGAEIGGIKFHAAIDVIIRNNHFHHCTRGIWLDWQVQGTRVSSNLFHDNCMPYDYLLKEKNTDGLGLGEDLFIEIAHGPTLVDNNIFLSERAIKLPTQGVAFVHNFFAGSITAVGVGVKNGSKEYDSTRYTPVHAPHSTAIVDFMSVLHGDVRFYNNVFVQQPVREGLTKLARKFDGDVWDDCNLICGTKPYDGYMTEEVWMKDFEGYCGEGAPGTRDKYYRPLPIYTGGNVFFGGAVPCDIEKDGYTDNDHVITWELVEAGDTEHGFDPSKTVFATNLEGLLPSAELITSETLGKAFEPEERFETPNGEDIIFNTNYYGQLRGGNISAGPF